MKLYLLSQNEQAGYDTYDSCVVCAENEEEAKKIRPNGETDWNVEFCTYPNWCKKIENVTCQYIGLADLSIEKGVVIASYNAG